MICLKYYACGWRLFLGITALKRGTHAHILMSSKAVLEYLPLRFGGFQRGGGILKRKISSTVQQWSASPAAMAGVRFTQR